MKTEPTTAAVAHTPGPWKVMADPKNEGKHPFHDSRFIATANAFVEHSRYTDEWTLERGSLICEMRDGPTANARLISAAPELLAALQATVAQFDFTVAAMAKGQTVSISSLQNCSAAARAAIAKATGQA